MERELTLGHVVHPEFVEGWQRVDHPVLARLTDGDPTLGWEGDPRLAVYLHGEARTLALWRLEADMTYRPVAHLQPGQVLGEQEVDRVIRRLVEIDQRRGFDPAVSVLAAMDQADHAAETDRTALIHDFADKLLYGLSRSHIPGIDVTMVRNAPSRR